MAVRPSIVRGFVFLIYTYGQIEKCFKKSVKMDVENVGAPPEPDRDALDGRVPGSPGAVSRGGRGPG